jgi:hypothetical protein
MMAGERRPNNGSRDGGRLHRCRLVIGGLLGRGLVVGGLLGGGVLVRGLLGGGSLSGERLVSLGELNGLALVDDPAAGQPAAAGADGDEDQEIGPGPGRIRG